MVLLQGGSKIVENQVMLSPTVWFTSDTCCLSSSISVKEYKPRAARFFSFTFQYIRCMVSLDLHIENGDVVGIRLTVQQ